MSSIKRELLNGLSALARQNFKRRQHYNLHKSYTDHCQRLFNAIEPGSYIRPHRHLSDPKDEMLIAIRGLMAVVMFSDSGSISKVLRIGTHEYGNGVAVGAEISPSKWHTVIALEPGSILFEVKAGPFDDTKPKDLASWAPEEGSQHASNYLRGLQNDILDW